MAIRSDLEARLARLKRRATAALVWEQLWPPLAIAGAVVALFAAVSWFGVWYETTPLSRLVGLCAFGLAILAALAPLLRLRPPSEAAALSRLDRDAGRPHQPASGLVDELANTSEDPLTQALWRLHRQRLVEQSQRLRVATPAPHVAARDPYALRFLALMLAVIGALAAGSERIARLASAFGGMPEIASAAGARVDAWIDPPPYTGRPPLFLKLGPASESVEAPEGSALVLRTSAGKVDARIRGALKPEPAKSDSERRFLIGGDGEAVVLRDGTNVGDIRIKAAAKTAPSIRLLDPPQSNYSGSLTLHYAIEDAYGVREAHGEVALAELSPPKHMLFGPPPLPLSLPGGANGTGESKTTADLSEHPWAGAPVLLTLKATSVSQGQAASKPVELILPQRRFNDPLAKALVEQRRDLVLDPDRNRPHVARALAALTLGPDVFGMKANIYLGLQGAQNLLTRAKTDDELREVAAWLWAMALQIENGDASKSLKDLRAAEQALRDALKRNASPEELKKLTEALKQAAERYLAEMSRNADKQAMEDAEPMDSQDLDAMLDKLERQSNNGDKEEAQATLDQLQEMMENLREAQSGQSNPSAKQMRQSMRELQKLLKDQQALRDDTFRDDQRDRSGNEKEDEGKSSDSLDKRQQALRDRLKKMEQQLRGAGVDTPKNFEDAENKMAEAEKDLKDGDGQGSAKRRFGHTAKGDAVDAQGQAIEALRQGGESMQQQARGKGKGKGGYVGVVGPKRGQQDDPLGRGDRGLTGAAEGALNTGPDRAERARRVLEELRRRLGNPNRPTDERDYIERLIGQLPQ